MSHFFDIINMTGVILEILVTISFFNAVSHKKDIPLHSEIVYYIICMSVQSVILLTIDNQMIVTAVLFLVITAIAFCYKLSWLKRSLFSFVLMILFVLSELVVGLFLTIVTGISVERFSENILYYMQGVLISKLIMFVFIKIIDIFSVKSEIIVKKTIVSPLIVLPIATLLIVYVVSELTFEAEPDILLNIAIIASIFLIISNILIFYIFEYQLKIAEAEKQEQMLKQQLEYKAEYYKELSKKQQITNKTMHDLKNQLFALRDTLECDTDEGIEKINNICEDILSVCTLKFSGIEAVDALITAKLQIMNEKNIRFINSIYISEKNFFDILDFCVLLGNLLDNAIEASEKVDIDKRYVNLSIIQQLDYISIHISNPINEIVDIKENMITTTKKYKEIHGFGLRSVNEIAKRYNGKCTYLQENNIFEVIVMLKNT